MILTHITDNPVIMGGIYGNPQKPEQVKQRSCMVPPPLHSFGQFRKRPPGSNKRAKLLNALCLDGCGHREGKLTVKSILQQPKRIKVAKTKLQTSIHSSRDKSGTTIEQGPFHSISTIYSEIHFSPS